MVAYESAVVRMADRSDMATLEIDPPKGTFIHGYPYWRRMQLVPHGHTVLVDPDLPPDRTDSGAIMLPEDQDYVPTSGVVVAVGKGSKRLWEERQKAYRRVLAYLGDPDTDDGGEMRIREELHRLLAPTPTPSVAIGDRVVFGPSAGLVVKDEDGHSYLLLDEDHIAIVVEESALA